MYARVNDVNGFSLSLSGWQGRKRKAEWKTNIFLHAILYFLYVLFLSEDICYHKEKNSLKREVSGILSNTILFKEFPSNETRYLYEMVLNTYFH